MDLTLKIWRQKSSNDQGKMVTYHVTEVSPDSSFFEMLDMLNQQLIENNQEPVAFDHDCREGICGTCSLFINGRPHGPKKAVTTCQLHMRSFSHGDTIYIEPWRARAFPVIRDLIVDRGALDSIIQAGGYVSVNTGGVPDANVIPIPTFNAEKSMDAASCIGCGACIASCANASAMLFVSAKVAHLDYLPQGKVETVQRVQRMVRKMDELGFGNCSNMYACEAECPKEISISNIALMNRKFISTSVCAERDQI